MRILVTGGAGFIASHIVDRYIADGHTVSVVDNLSSGKKERLNPSAHFYQVDIRDADSLKSVFEQEKPEIVNHHAAQIDVRKSIADPAFDADVNLIGLLRLLELSREHNVTRFLFASSGGAIYPDADTFPTPEIHEPRPQSPYGVSKYASEIYLAMVERLEGLPFVALRYGNVYGPRQDPHGEAGVVAIFIGKLLAHETPTIFGDGEQMRDYVFVADVVSANVLSLNGPSGVFNIGTGEGTSVNALFQNINNVMGKNMKAIEAPGRVGEAKKSVLSWEKAKAELGWSPQTPLIDGIRKTVEFFQL
ncbi:MAG: NAD-dependent epimerase/dehydratase family protein [bacterium]|nr:NAD-dependent epimerase/dehydratase family protein [bacterium]